MEFHEYLSHFEYSQRTTPEAAAFGIDRFYETFLELGANDIRLGVGDEKLEAQFRYSHHFGERLWHQNQQPYFLVHPRIIETFTETKMSAGPEHSICLPFDNFVLLLPKEQNTMRWKGDLPVKSIFLSHREQKGQHHLLIYFTIQTSETEETTEMCRFDYHHHDTPDERSIEEMITEGREEDELAKVTLRGIRLALSAGILLERKNPLIEPHILNVDLKKYYEGDEEQKKKLEQKAVRRRKKRGYRFAVDRQFSVGLIIAPPKKGSQETEYVRGPLTNAHFRSGHWQRVWYGPKKSLCRIDWFMPTLVRPDLPFKPKEKK